jgi:hypothetical protein
MENPRLQGMIWASFAADSLALGPHWMYDQDKIEQKFGMVQELTAPLPASQHAGKRAGEEIAGLLQELDGLG